MYWLTQRDRNVVISTVTLATFFRVHWFLINDILELTASWGAHSCKLTDIPAYGETCTQFISMNDWAYFRNTYAVRVSLHESRILLMLADTATKLCLWSRRRKVIWAAWKISWGYKFAPGSLSRTTTRSAKFAVIRYSFSQRKGYHNTFSRFKQEC